MKEQPTPPLARNNGTMALSADDKRQEVRRWWHPLIIAAYLGTVASLAASALAASTGSMWLASLAVLLVGTASLLPDFLDYQQTRRALAETRRQAARPKAAAWPVSEQAIKLPESFSQTIH